MRHKGWRWTSEYASSQVQTKWPRLGTANALPPTLVKDRYRTRGYTIQLEVPFPEFFLSEQTNMIIRGESLKRWGPQLNRLGEYFEDQRVETRTNKYSGGLNTRITQSFMTKVEFGLWTFNHGDPSIYQVLFAAVITF
jgi:hypothetical protein